MKRALLTRRACLSALAGRAVCAAAAADWKSKAFPQWNDDTVLRLLVDSPWAHTRLVKIEWFGKKEAARDITYKDIPGTQPGIAASSTAPGGSPVGGIGSGKIRNRLPDRADLIFRWSSALPVRQAKALYRVRQQKAADAAKVTEIVATRAGGTDYAFEVFGIPTEAAHSGTEAISTLFMRSAAIRTKAGRVIRAGRAVTELTGDVLTSTIFFPRQEPLRVEEQEIDVVGNIELFEFSERFRLKDMRYLDGLEI